MLGDLEKTLCTFAAAALVVGAGACNRRVNASDWGADGSESEEGFPDEEPPDLPPLAPSCNDGVVDPGEFCHELETERAAGIDPCDLTVHDFDGDGADDIAVPNSDFTLGEGAQHVSNVLLGTGDGQLLFPSAYPSGSPLPVGIDHGDFDGDGVTDLVTSNTDGAAVTILSGLGDGTFAGQQEIAVDGSASIVIAGDIDDDGIDDVMVTVPQNNRIAILRGPELVPVWIEVGESVNDIHLADVVGDDGIVDLLVSDFAGAVHIQRGDGTGGFDHAATVDGLNAPEGIAAGDLDSDGDLDLVVADAGSGTLEVIRNAGGSFELVETVVLGTPALRSVDLGDLDSDGVLDIVVSDTDDNHVYALLREDGEYKLYGAWLTGLRPVSIELGEFNGDGVPDIAVANQFQNSVSLINSAP